MVKFKKYIGKKSLISHRTKKVAGRKNRKHTISESDWREYFGSNEFLIEDRDKLGVENFTREILFYCKSKAETSYVEAKIQFEYKVLESNDFYNGHIQIRVHGSHIRGKI